MISIIRIFCILSVSILFQNPVIAQNDIMRQLIKLKKSDRYKIQMDSDQLIITNPRGHKQVFLLRQSNRLPLSNYIQHQIPRYDFNLNYIDTSITASYFRYLNSLPITNFSDPPIVSDVNNNNRLEIYGSQKEPRNSNRSPLLCYEEDARGVYKQIYRFPDSIYAAVDFFDPNNDGKMDLLTSSVRFDSVHQLPYKCYPFFKKNDSTSIPNSYLFPISIYDVQSGWQLNDIAILDLDKNNIMDVILWDLTVPAIWIGKYDSVKREFVKTISFPLFTGPRNERDYISSFVTGDLKNDGKTSVVCSSVFGNIYLIQHNGGNDFSKVNIGNTGIVNSYIAFKTNDLNSNGKPEIWLGGIDFELGETRLYGYEFDGNSTFQPFCEIRFLMEANLLRNSGRETDIDGDGRGEIVLEFDTKLVVLKLNQNGNSLEPTILYYKNFNAPSDSFMVDNITLLKEPIHGIPLLLVGGTKSVGISYKTETHLYVPKLLNEVVNTHYAPENKLSLRIYPNPVYEEATFEVLSSVSDVVSLCVVNILGQVIYSNELQLEGGKKKHFIWNCMDSLNSKISAGIYFLVLSNGKNTIACKFSRMAKEFK